MSFVLGAKTELLVAAYSFTSKEIAFALAEAKARGIDVRVVVDHAQNTDDQGGYKAVDYLSSQGIPVFRCENYAAMHHKFMVADGLHVQLGSFNYVFREPAQRRNGGGLPQRARVGQRVPD